MAAYLQRLSTAVPAHDVHTDFGVYARGLLDDERQRLLFDRMSERSGIEHRYSFLAPGRLAEGEIDAEGFYRRGHFPGTGARMARYAVEAPRLALQAVRGLVPAGLPAAALARELDSVTHLVVASCTGFVAPGLDVQLIDALGLRSDVQRTLVGFMGCAAALPALRVAQQTVLADPGARVLVVCVELCSLHLQESAQLEKLLSFVLFGDAAAAALVGSRPGGLELEAFGSRLLPEGRSLITWEIGDLGFEMQLSGLVPGRIAEALAAERTLGEQATDADRKGRAVTLGSLLLEAAPDDYRHWAVHAGGRTVLDAVQLGLALAPAALADSRAVLRDVGNVSSVTVMFVLQRMLAGAAPGGLGLALAFGPGLSAEAMRFRVAGPA